MAAHRAPKPPGYVAIARQLFHGSGWLVPLAIILILAFNLTP